MLALFAVPVEQVALLLNEVSGQLDLKVAVDTVVIIHGLLLATEQLAAACNVVLTSASELNASEQVGYSSLGCPKVNGPTMSVQRMLG